VTITGLRQKLDEIKIAQDQISKNVKDFKSLTPPKKQQETFEVNLTRTQGKTVTQNGDRSDKNKTKSLWKKPAQENRPLEYLDRRRFSEGLKLDRVPPRSSILMKRPELVALDSYLLGISVQGGDSKQLRGGEDSICST